MTRSFRSPMPAGPFVTEKEKTAAAHHCAEKGTTCWLAGKCDRPSSYAYDQDIAFAFKSALTANNPFEKSTLWVTVQGCVVYIEGCTEDSSLARKVEIFTMVLAGSRISPMFFMGLIQSD